MEPPHTLWIDQPTLNATGGAGRTDHAVRDERTSSHARRAHFRWYAEPDNTYTVLRLTDSTGIVAAAAGMLTIMFGSPSPLATSLVRPLLGRMAREGGVIQCGGNGTGVGVKVCNKSGLHLLRMNSADPRPA